MTLLAGEQLTKANEEGGCCVFMFVVVAMA